MATHREIRQFVASSLGISAILSLLGTVTPTNARIYSGWPQQQPILSSREPGEGWIVFTIEIDSNFTDIREDILLEINIWSTLASRTDDVMDEIDGLFNYKLAGQNSCLIGTDRNVLFSQRANSADLYETDTKLYRKRLTYQFATVKAPFKSGS